MVNVPIVVSTAHPSVQCLLEGPVGLKDGTKSDEKDALCPPFHVEQRRGYRPECGHRSADLPLAGSVRRKGAISPHVGWTLVQQAVVTKVDSAGACLPL